MVKIGGFSRSKSGAHPPPPPPPFPQILRQLYFLAMLAQQQVLAGQHRESFFTAFGSQVSPVLMLDALIYSKISPLFSTYHAILPAIQRQPWVLPAAEADSEPKSPVGHPPFMAPEILRSAELGHVVRRGRAKPQPGRSVSRRPTCVDQRVQGLQVDDACGGFQSQRLPCSQKISSTSTIVQQGLVHCTLAVE